MGVVLPQPLKDALDLRGLRATGGFEAEAKDALPAGVQTVLLLSPRDDFWRIFTASHEYQDGKADPMDRWSYRVLTRLAKEVGAHAFFPFGSGAEAAPFFAWAQRSGRAWSSPVKLLVGADMGLNLSFLGALGLRERLDFAAATPPCQSCGAPCAVACPAGALTPEGYDVPKCQAYLASHPDSPCRNSGCQVRRACPVSSAQSAPQARFHMDAFLS